MKLPLWSLRKSVSCSLLVLVSFLPSARATLATTSAADQAWENITAPLDGLTPQTVQKKLGNTPESEIWRTRWARQYRERGLAFWEQFPDDSRRWDWFWLASSRGSVLVTYALDPKLVAWNTANHHWGSYAFAIDHEAQQKWEAKYLRIRPQYLALTDPRWTKNHPTFLQEELYQRLYRAGEAVRRGEPVDRYGLMIDYENFICRSDVSDSKVIWMAQAFLSSRLLQDDRDLQRAFLGAMRLSTRAEMRDIAAGEQNMLDHLEQPIDFKVPLLIGTGEADLAKLRGKVVLLDIYSLNCSGCWESMPVYHALYDRYHRDGLEIISLCGTYGDGDTVNEAYIGMGNLTIDQWKKVVAERLQKLDARWTCAYMSGVLDVSLRRKYAIVGAPRTYLFDQSGKLAASDEDGWGFERHIRQLLKLPALKPGEEIRPAAHPTP